MSEVTELSIVIPAKNEAVRLPALLDCLCRQDYPGMAETPIYVADAGSTDETVMIAESFKDRLKVTVVDGGLPSVGRNNGARHATTEFVLFLDADVELRDATLLRRAVARMKGRRLHCLTVDIACAGGDWKDRLLYRANSFFQKLSSWTLPFGTGMFLLFERARFEALGGFDEEAVFAEDFLLTKQISILRFSVLDGEVYTSNRRFRRTGHGRMVFLFFWTLVNSQRDSYFKHDHGYWNEAPAVKQ